MRVRIPFNWQPRPYQRKLWEYLEDGGKRAVAVWHRRAGKDDLCLHWTCVAAHLKIATYWHMLPEATQARKAIWEAINPHTGKRRIDEAFPVELRETTREQEMMIKFKCGSTWQVVGSDNFNSLVGSPPAGVVFSEWSIANPAAWGYMRPILAENGGWALFIYTPRGKNHGYSTFQMAEESPDWFCQKLGVDETMVFAPQDLEREKHEYVKELGPEAGEAMFQQEYYCSFEAAILGAVYGAAMARAEKQQRVCEVAYDKTLPVHTAWDLGFDDSTSIWFWQVARNEVRLIDYYETNGRDVKFYCDYIKEKPYNYGRHYVPHDAANKLLAAGGRSIVEQMAVEGINVLVIPSTAQQNSIEATRKMLEIAWFDREKCAHGIEALKQYQFTYDDEKKVFSKKPRHDWSSHAADSVEIISRVWQNPVEEIKTPTPRFLTDMTADEVFWDSHKPQSGYRRI